MWHFFSPSPRHLVYREPAAELQRVLTREPDTSRTGVCGVKLLRRGWGGEETRRAFLLRKSPCFCATLTLQLLEERMSEPNLCSESIKARPSRFACKKSSLFYSFFFLQQACNEIVGGNSICLQALIIYLICHHLVCQWPNLLGLHFLVFTPTRAQAPG